ETLPEEYSTRRSNRGFEGMALDTDSGILYAFIQTPLANPDLAASNASDVIRMLGIDPATGQPVAEYVYLLEGLDYRTSKVDKIGDAIYAGNGQFYTAERDSSTEAYAKKLVFRVDLEGATNLLDPDAPPLLPGKTLEQHTADELAGLGIRVVNKVKVTNLPSIGYRAGDKTEGLALLPGGQLAVLNDNDFGLLDAPIAGDGSVPLNPNPTPVELGIIDFGSGNRLDASDRDDGIRIRRWPVYGAFMPDALSSFEVNGNTYYVTANEGDARNEDERIKDLMLDPGAFPDAGWLQQDANIGRLGVSSIDGDIDGDGYYEQLWAYGARSFSVWDQFGNLVYDSSDDFEQTTAVVVPDIFNSDGDAGSFDSRSDNKGPEPEGVDTGQVNGRTYAFVGLERVGGIMVYDVTTPYAPIFASYAPQPAEDRSPEGILFVSLADSPVDSPLLIATHEVSGTVTIYAVESYDPAVMRSRRYNLTMDTFINGTQPDTNFDGNQVMWVGFLDQMRTLAQAPVPVCNDPLTCVPPDSQIDAAYLYLYVHEGRGYGTWADSVINVSVHALNSPWAQETATWNFPWGTPGGDFGPAVDTIHLGSGKVGTWMRFDVTDAVAQALLSGKQFGFALTSDDFRGVRYSYATQDYFDPSKAGYLRVMFRSYRSVDPDAPVVAPLR
ncbi:MAG: choice-of-anchor I domain-containing protein, partial [Anaerolineae bacterium]